MPRSHGGTSTSCSRSPMTSRHGCAPRASRRCASLTPPAPPSSSHDVLYVGRLSADKGVDVLLEAWPAVTALHPDARLLVAGDGPEQAALTARVATTPSVRMLGRLAEDEVSSALAAARVLVAPSLPAIRPEGAPLVVVEAAMHGRPVVTSDDAGLAALVTKFGNGVAVRAGDATALAAAVGELLADGARADRLGAAGRDAAADHSPDRVVAAVRACYADVIEARG